MQWKNTRISFLLYSSPFTANSWTMKNIFLYFSFPSDIPRTPLDSTSDTRCAVKGSTFGRTRAAYGALRRKWRKRHSVTFRQLLSLEDRRLAVSAKEAWSFWGETETALSFFLRDFFSESAAPNRWTHLQMIGFVWLVPSQMWHLKHRDLGSKLQ